MPGFDHLPIAFGGLNTEGEITAAVVSLLTSQLVPLAVQTVEEWHPQIEDTPRQYKKASLPAVWVWAAPAGIGRTLCQMIDLDYVVHIGVAVEDGNTQEGRGLHERIRENIGGVLELAYFKGSTSLLTSGHQVFFSDWSSGDMKRGFDDKNPWMLWSDNTIRCRVVVPDTIME